MNPPASDAKGATGPRVRFAPSPTGYLHVGGARTAIFNWLLARKLGGTFVLRIEDTDRERSSDAMVQAILDGMAWLGMAPDEGPFFQSAERERHVDDARELLERDAAYRCFCTPEAIAERRREAEAAGGGYRYERTCAAIPRDASAGRAAAGEAFAVRFRMPAETIAWDDAVHGETAFPGDAIEDFILLRRDGSPTYMLSVVSDDCAHRVTHVVRGDDHLSNTPKQIALYRALGRDVPTFAHLPLILGEDKKRLSKRHGAVSILEYRDRGILPDAMFNFLALLGWNPGGDADEKLARDDLVTAFGFEGIGKSGAVFDLTKLGWLNGRYVAEMPARSFAEAARGALATDLPDLATVLDGHGSDWAARLFALLQPRCKVVADVAELAKPYLVPDDAIDYEAKPAKKHLKGDDLLDRLAALREALAGEDDWTADPLEARFRELAESREISAGKLIHPTRLAVTGRGASPGIFEVLELLGKERTLARLDRLVDRLRAGTLPG